MRVLIGVLTVSLLVIACGNSSPSATIASPIPIPTLVPTPTLTQAELGTKYLAMVGPSNKLIDAMNVVVAPAHMSFTRVRRVAAALEAADVTLNGDLLAFGPQVPVAVQPDVAAARLALSSDIADLQTIVASTTYAQLDAAVNAWITDGNKDSKAFVLLRSDLGLPPPT
jgi:hypothetical protein